MRTSIKRAAAVALTAASVLGVADTSGATPPPAPAGDTTGFDEINDIVVSGGSDATYALMNNLTALYVASPGCARKITSSPADTCATGQTGTAPYANWDHDVVAQVFPTGSSSGVNCLLGTGGLTCNQTLDTARSSRPLSATEITNGARQWGIARDGLAVIQFSGRAGVNVNKTDLQNIYNCVNNPATGQPYTWADLGDTGPNSADPVIPVGQNSGSGTANDFAVYLGFANIGALNAKTCVHKLASGVAPFENDVKQLRDDTGVPTGLTGPEASTPLSTLYTQGKAMWWISYASFKTLPYQRLTATTLRVDNKIISNGSIANTGPTGWPIGRYVYQITRATDADMSTTNYPNILGTNQGKGGAVREFMRFVCKNAADHTLNGDTGTNYFDDIETGILSAGFISVPLSQRQWGRCRK